LIYEEIDSTRRNDPTSFDIDGELENINPLLLDFVNSITATVPILHTWVNTFKK